MFKKFLYFFSLFTCYSFLITSPIYAQNTTPWTNRCAPTIDGIQVATIQGLECLFANVLTVITYIAGISFFFIFIVNGFKYIFSGSDQKQLAQINSSITLAVIGLVGIIISWLVLSFIQNIFFGVGTPFDVTKFTIPGGN